MMLYTLRSGEMSGQANMALDSTLLDTVVQLSDPVLVVRTYRWARPTLSLGLHQPERDLASLLARYEVLQPDVVRRPTGGRAILHGEDIAFSFTTNLPELLKQSVSDSFCALIQHIKATLLSLDVNVESSPECNSRAYTRSPVCFETQTPSDLVLADGRKIAGSAQCRRAGGMLQHGSVFLTPPPDKTTYEAFSSTLFDIVCNVYQQAPIDLGPYLNESGGIDDKAWTTAGSQRVPASA